MRRIIFLVTLCFCSFPAFALDWQQPAPGIFYTKLRVAQPDQDAYLDVFRIDLHKFIIKPLWSSSRKTAQQFATDSRALIVINANFFDEKSQALGLVQEGGRTINPLKNISWWSVFCLKDQKATIVHTSQAKGLICDNAVQAGPRLVVGGTIPKLKADLSFRTAVGINRKHEVVFIVSRDLIQTKELAVLLSNPESAGGLDCADALNLDGGTSSQIYASFGGLHVSFGGFTGIPVALGVFQR